MYKIDYEKEAITIEAVDKLVWVNNCYNDAEEDVPIEISFKNILVADWGIELLHNQKYAEFMVCVRDTDGWGEYTYSFMGKTEFIEKMYDDVNSVVDGEGSE